MTTLSLGGVEWGWELGTIAYGDTGGGGGGTAMITKYLPLGETDYYVGTVGVQIRVMLLRDDVTSADIPDTLSYRSDVSSLQISNGDYPFFGILMPSVNRVENSTAGVVEYDTGTALWQSASSYTCTGFRWLVAYSQAGNTILSIWDLGASSALSAEPLSLVVAASTSSPGVYPILRIRRNLT